MPPEKTKRKNKILLCLMVILLCFSVLSLLNYYFPLPLKRLHPAHSTVIKNQDGSIARIFLSPDGFLRQPMTAAQMTPLIQSCTLFFEDQYFYYHPGFNPFSVLRAIFHNISHKRKIGASTITMQLARMIEQRPRTIGAKIVEIFRSLQIEWHFTKDEILLFYLNMAPYGGNIEGFKSAASAYFNKEPDKLSLAEIALLVQIPKNPNQNRPDRLKNPEQQKNQLLHKLLKTKLFATGIIKRAIQEKPEILKPENRIFAPHFTNHPQIKALVTARETFINSSIAPEMQKFLEKTLKNNLAIQSKKGIKNAAALIIHNHTMQIRAYAGSENFYSSVSGGQNDGLRMKRSPGSALKPFIYALALEQGLITPKRQLPDIPINFSGYSPKNYGEHYHGLIAAEKALRLSLNTPAVQLNEAMSTDFSLYELLQKAEIKSLDRHKNHYGAAISLGAAELSLLELTHLYTIFPNSGQLHPLYFTIDKQKKHNTEKVINLITPQSAWLIADILAEAPRNTLNSYWSANPKNAPVSFKTGTSARRSDFITIGFTSEYTVGVWYGNFCGRKADYGSGMDTAAPTLLQIFAWLQNQNYPPPIIKPEKITRQETCADLLQAKDYPCQNPVTDYIIADIQARNGCQLLQAEQLNYLIRQGLYKINDIKKICLMPVELPPEIRYPPQTINTFFLSKAIPAQYQKNRFECHSYQQKDSVYLFINGLFHKKMRSGESEFISLPPGQHELGCMDEKAIYSSVQVSVKE